MMRAARGSLRRRSAMRMARRDRGQAPRLAPGSLGLGPGDGLPVGREDQPRTGIAQFDPVPAWLVDVQEEGLLDGVLMRAGLDEDALFEADVRGPQECLPA